MKITGLYTSLLFAAVSAAPAFGQPSTPTQTYVAPPAEQMLLSPGGVDMRNQQYQFRQVDISIGGEGTAGLALVRGAMPIVFGHVSPFGNVSHNWDILAVESRVKIDAGDFAHSPTNPDYRMVIRLNGIGDTFQAYGAVSANYTQASQTTFALLTYTNGTKASGTVTYRYQASDGVVYLFRPMGNKDCSNYFRCAFVSRIDHPDGTRLDFEYENPEPGVANRTRLRSVVSSRGYALLLEYGAEGDWNFINKACVLNLAYATKPASNICPSGADAVASYGYVTFTGRRLASATDATGATWGYLYEEGEIPARFRMKYVKPGEVTPWLTNFTGISLAQNEGSKEIVYGQIFATGEQYAYDFYDPSSTTGGVVTSLMGGTITNATSVPITVEYSFPVIPPSELPPSPEPPLFGDQRYQVTPGPTRIVDRLGRETTYDYCNPLVADGCLVDQLQSFVDPGGITTHLTYDGFGNVSQVRRVAKPASGLSDIVLSTTWACLAPATCTKPLVITDAKGARTFFDYQYFESGVIYGHGGILRREEGIPAGPPGVPPDPNRITPVTRYSYVQRTARISDGGSGTTPAATAIWLLNDERTCRTTKTIPAASGSPTPEVCAGGASDEVVTRYEYGPTTGPNTLLLRGVTVTADGVTRRTCYTNDRLGNRVSETKPLGAAALTACP